MMTKQQKATVELLRKHTSTIISRKSGSETEVSFRSTTPPRHIRQSSIRKPSMPHRISILEETEDSCSAASVKGS